jgi:large subunit ribosomal protein L18e
MKTNPQLQETITALRRKAYSEESPLWLRIAEDLERPTRQRVIVNLSRINRFAQDGETVVVPGKVLASGELDKKVTVVAFQFSQTAREKIAKTGAAFCIDELADKGISGRIRIMG